VRLRILRGVPNLEGKTTIKKRKRGGGTLGSGSGDPQERGREGPFYSREANPKTTG